MSVANWILGRSADVSGKCRWCKRAPVTHLRRPLPICDGCHLRGNHGNNLARAWAEFPAEFTKWIKRMQSENRSRPTATDFVGIQMEGTSDLITLQQRIANLPPEKKAEIDALRAELEQRKRRIADYTKAIPSMMRDMMRDSEGDGR